MDGERRGEGGGGEECEGKEGKGMKRREQGKGVWQMQALAKLLNPYPGIAHP